MCLFVAIICVKQKTNTIEFAEYTLGRKRQCNYIMSILNEILQVHMFFSSSSSAVLLKSRCMSVKVRKISKCRRKL